MTRLRDSQAVALFLFTALLLPVSFAIAHAVTETFGIPIWLTLPAAWAYAVPLPGFIGLVDAAGGTPEDWNDGITFPLERQVNRLTDEVKQLRDTIDAMQTERANQ